jgi:hypothetical protein
MILPAWQPLKIGIRPESGGGDAGAARKPCLTGLPTLITNGTNLRRQPSLRSQLNQIRMWVRQGRTDPWIAHKLDVSVDELARFKREHALDGGDEGTRARPADPLSVPAPEPRSEVFEESAEEEEDEGAAEREPERERERPRRRSRRRPRRPVPADDIEEEEEEEEEEDLVAATEADDEVEDERDRRAGRGERDDGAPDGGAPRRRRRGRRGGRRHRARRNAYEATFDHGEEGYGLWLDPAVVDNPLYSEHWAGHRAVTVTVEAESITIRRAGDARGPGSESGHGEADE